MPELIIEPTKGLGRLRVKELWEYRELLYFMIWRDIKVRYKQTFFGASWAVVQPLLLMVVFSIFFGKLARIPSEGLPYPLFAYTALVPWTFFAQSLSGASSSLVSGSNLVSKVYFPRLILPITAVGSFVLDLVIAFALLLAMMLWYGITPTKNLWAVVPLAMLAMLTSLAVGIWFAALNVKYRDVQYVVPFLIQVWLFASPIVYSTSLVPVRFRTWYGLNPMAGVAEGFRWSLLGTNTRPGSMIAVSVAVTLLTLGAGAWYFQRVERSFADVI